MARRIVLTVVFGLVAAAFAAYGLSSSLRAAKAAPDNASQCLEKESEIGGGLLF